MTITKIELRQRDLQWRYRDGRKEIESATLSNPGQEGELTFPDNGEPSQLVQLDIHVGADTHRLHIHLPTPGHNKTVISWHKV